MTPTSQDLAIEDIVQIHQLLALYGHAADAAKHRSIEHEASRRLDRVFTADAVWDMTAGGGRRYEGLDAIRAMFAVPPPHHPPSHHTTNPYVFVEAGVVRAKSKWLVTDHENQLIQGEYHDVVVPGDAGWWISERLLIVLGPAWTDPQ